MKCIRCLGGGGRLLHPSGALAGICPWCMGAEEGRWLEEQIAQALKDIEWLDTPSAGSAEKLAMGGVMKRLDMLRRKKENFDREVAVLRSQLAGQ